MELQQSSNLRLRLIPRHVKNQLHRPRNLDMSNQSIAPIIMCQILEHSPVRRFDEAGHAQV